MPGRLEVAMKTNTARAWLAVVVALGLGCQAVEPTDSNEGDGASAPAAGAPSTQAGASGVGASAGSGGAGAQSVGVAGTTAAGASAAGSGGAAGAATLAGSGGSDGALAAGAGAAGAAGGGAGIGGAASPFPQLPRVTTTDGPGSFTEVVKVKSTPPGGWLIYPKEIGKDGMKHPLFIFGPGGGTTPMTYETSGMHWDRYASYGFVIYVLPMSTGDGAAMKEGLDWLIMQNDDMSSPLYQHLDTSKVCAAGHSQGSVTTFAFMPDERVTTTIHISGGSFDGLGPSHLKTDTMFMCADQASGDPAYPQCEGDFMNSTIPTYYTIVMGADHLTSARLGWAATIAWMLWHLAGQEDQWKKEFLEPTGQFQTGIYQSKIKNWP
jgi:hypothetical protein